MQLALTWGQTHQVVPLPSSLSNVMVPPCASVSRLTTARPNPCPFDFVVNNGVNSFSFTSFGMSVPESLTVITVSLGHSKHERTDCRHLLLVKNLEKVFQMELKPFSSRPFNLTVSSSSLLRILNQSEIGRTSKVEGG